MAPQAVRVLISYAHGDPDEDEVVREFWTLLRREGVDARIDLTAAVNRQFWPQWIDEQIEAADYVLVVVSPRYKALAEGRDVPGLGVPWEARQLQEKLHARFSDGMRRIVPVVLPRYSRADIPRWLYPAGGTSYVIPELTSDGIDGLMRMLTDQPLDVDAPLGQVLVRPPRVFISYADESNAHAEAVRDLWIFLRSHGVDAQLDRVAAQRRQDWALWMERQVREADHVLVIASAAYRARAQDESSPDVGRGVQWEARLIRNTFYRDQRALDRFVPVVLPGQSIEGVPDFLAPVTSTVYIVSEFTVAGAEPLLRLLLGQLEETEPPLGTAPVLGSRPHTSARTEWKARDTGLGGDGPSDAVREPPWSIQQSLIYPTALQSGIFISYRRADAEDFAGRLYDRLLRSFKESQVFMDVDSIELGMDFVDVINSSLQQCKIMLVIIGKTWLTTADSSGKRRLDDPDDLVRLEVREALRRNLRVIPILAQGAAMPKSEDLPADLASLARRHGHVITHAKFTTDTIELTETLKRILEH